MLTRPSQYLTASLISFLLFLIPCIFLLPEIFRQDLGISNYGVNRLTIIPYSLGFLSSAYFSWRAATKLKNKIFTRSLQLVCLLQLALLAVPDSHIASIRYTHIGIGMTLFVAEFSLACILVVTICRKFTPTALLALQAIAGLSAFFSLGQILPFEAPSQLLFQLCFLLICTEAARQLESRQNTEGYGLQRNS